MIIALQILIAFGFINAIGYLADMALDFLYFDVYGLMINLYLNQQGK